MKECSIQSPHALRLGLPETVKVEFAPAGVWLSENLRVLSGSAIALHSTHWNDYGLLLGSIEHLRSLIQQNQPEIGLMIIMSPDYLLAGIIVVGTGEAIAFTRGAAAQKVIGEVYLGITEKGKGEGVRGKGMQANNVPFTLFPLPFNLPEGLLGEKYEK